jgi:hypothetical protein
VDDEWFRQVRSAEENSSLLIISIAFRINESACGYLASGCAPVTEGYQRQTCAGCAEYFQVGKGVRRIHAKKCSPKCRKRLSQEDGKNAVPNGIQPKQPSMPV